MTETPRRSQAEKDMLKSVHELLGATRDGFEGIAQELKRLQDRNYTQESSLRDMSTNLALQEKDLKRILTIIDGNGEKALTVRLAFIENQLNVLEKALQKFEEEYKEDKRTMGQRIWEIAKPIIAAAVGAAIAMGTGAAAL